MDTKASSTDSRTASTVKVGSIIAIPFKFGGTAARRRVLARKGVWVLHRSLQLERRYTVTHLPTMCSATQSIRSATVGKRALRDFASIPGNWNFTDPAKMSKRQKYAGTRLWQRIARDESR